jgi:hypothetical protein
VSEPFDLDSDLTDLIRDAQPGDLLPSPAPGGPKVAVPVRVSPSTLEELKRLAAERGVGHTTLMAQLVEAAVAEMTADDRAMVPLAEVRRIIAQLAVGRPPAA